MALNYKNFLKGVGIVPKSSSDNSVLGDMEVLSTSTKLEFHNGTSSSPLVTEAHASQGTHRLKSKDLEANTLAIVDTADVTKKIAFQVSGAGSATTLTIISAQTVSCSLTLPDATTTMVGTDVTQTLTNKTISGSSNTISNIPDSALSSNIVTLTGVQTLTNKTLTSPVISTISNTGTVTLPTATTTLVGRDTSDTLTNKTLTSPILNTPTADTITGIAGGSLILRSASSQTLVLNSQGTTILEQIAGATVGTWASTGLTLASNGTLSLVANAQTVSLQANSAASASYTITVPAAAPTANTALVYNGSSYVWGAAGGWVMHSNTSLTGGGTLAISTTEGQQVWEVQGSSAAVTLSVTPFGTTAPTNGVTIRLIGRSNTNTVTISNNDAAKGCLVNGTPVLGLGDAIELQYLSSIDRYVEVARNF